jgi:3-hydroxy-3-methylglutaryl CoA synthase
VIPGEKAVANFDEDSLSMGVNVALHDSLAGITLTKAFYLFAITMY